MNSTKLLLREIKTIETKIQLMELQRQAIKSSLLAESLIDMLVDVILGPFIHMDAINIKNTPEYKNAMAKVKEIQKVTDKLRIKGEKLQKEYEEALRKQAKQKKNIAASKPTKRL